MTIISGVSVFQFVWNVHLFMGGFGLFTCKPTSPVTLDIYKWSRVPPGLASCKFIKHFTFSDWCWILKRLWFDQSQMWFIKWKIYMDDIPASPCINSPHCKMSMISHFRNLKNLYFEISIEWLRRSTLRAYWNVILVEHYSDVTWMLYRIKSSATQLSA